MKKKGRQALDKSREAQRIAREAQELLERRLQNPPWLDKTEERLDEQDDDAGE